MCVCVRAACARVVWWRLGGCAVVSPVCGQGSVSPALKKKKLVRLLAVDHSARASMKNAASCEN